MRCNPSAPRATRRSRDRASAEQAREDRLVDLYVDSKLDQATYERQRQRLAGERQEAIDRLARASEDLDDQYLVTAERIFELAKQAKTLWKRRAPADQRQLLEMVLSNPRLEGVRARWAMKKPFAILAEMAKGGAWRARSDSNARPSDS
jgi:hypothetical protein